LPMPRFYYKACRYGVPMQVSNRNLYIAIWIGKIISFQTTKFYLANPLLRVLEFR
jgi:hypothetical protein